MISVDTNVFLYALNERCSEHAKAAAFLESLYDSKEVAIADYVLVELYLLLRNPSVVQKPLSAVEAANLCQAYRQNPSWQIVESESVMEGLWDRVANGDPDSPRRSIIDLRLGLTLFSAGVLRFATRNTKDFIDVGFEEVFDPLA